MQRHHHMECFSSETTTTLLRCTCLDSEHASYTIYYHIHMCDVINQSRAGTGMLKDIEQEERTSS